MNINAPSDENLYNIANWGGGYFSINPKGNVEIRKSPGEKGVELQAIVNAANRAGLHLPLLIRCSDILHDRVHRITQAFSQAIEENDYSGKYNYLSH